MNDQISDKVQAIINDFEASHLRREGNHFSYLVSDFGLTGFIEKSKASPQDVAGFLNYMYANYQKRLPQEEGMGYPSSYIYAKATSPQVFAFLFCGTLATFKRDLALDPAVHLVALAKNSLIPAQVSVSGGSLLGDAVAKNFESLKASLSTSSEPWVQDAVHLYGETPLLKLIDRCQKTLSLDCVSTCSVEMPDEQKVISEAMPQSTDDMLAQIKTTLDLSISKLKSNVQAMDAGLSELMSDDEAGRYSMVKHDKMTAAEAEADFERMIGLNEVKNRVKDMIHLELYNRARVSITGETDRLSFDNFVLAGPPGVGKTTMALKIGAILAANDFLGKKKTVFLSAKELVGGHIGHSEQNVRNLIKQGCDGVVVIDEIDSLARDKLTSFEQNVIDTLNVEIGNQKIKGHKTIFVLTGYPRGIKDFFRMNEGLASRFPHRFELKAYTDNELLQILRLRATEQQYHITHAAERKVFDEIMRVRHLQKERFSNARLLEEVLKCMTMAQSKKFSSDFLREVVDGRQEGASLMAQSHVLNVDTVPTYKAGEGRFVLHRSSTGPADTSAAIKKSKIISFPSLS